MSRVLPRKTKRNVIISRSSSFYLQGADPDTVLEKAKRNVFISGSSSFHVQGCNPELIPAKTKRYVHFDDNPILTADKIPYSPEIGELHKDICIPKELMQITFHRLNHKVRKLRQFVEEVLKINTKLDEAVMDSYLMNTRGSSFYRGQRIPIIREIARKENHIYLPMHSEFEE